MIKLKEVKAKSEDSGSKARQYLEGLLKILFGIYKKEKLLSYMDNIHAFFFKTMEEYGNMNNIQSLVNKDSIIVKDNYTNLEILNYTNYFETHLLYTVKNKECQDLIDKYISNKRDILISNICYINSVLKKHGLKIKFVIQVKK